MLYRVVGQILCDYPLYRELSPPALLRITPGLFVIRHKKKKASEKHQLRIRTFLCFFFMDIAKTKKIGVIMSSSAAGHASNYHK